MFSKWQFGGAYLMGGAQARGGFDLAALAEITPALTELVGQGALSGILTLIWHKDRVVHSDVVGQRDLEGGLPMEQNTLFRIASMTKPITSAAAMMFLEEGKLRLEDPITRWLPEFEDMKVLKDPSGPLNEVEPAARELTVEDLLTHRAGMAYSFASQGPIAYAYEEKLGSALTSPLTPDQWLKALGELPLSYQPGERFQYSQATDVLGFLLARIEGRTLGEVLHTRIFEPLGMTDTAFWLPPEARARLARLYQAPVAGGALKDMSFPVAASPPVFEGGGGGLISSAGDYLKFARMLLGRGEVDGVRLLSPETTDLMVTNRLTDAQRAHGFLGMPFWLSQGFGLGLSVIMDSAKHEWMGAGSAGSYGWPGAFGTWWQVDPANDAILIYMIQDSMPLGPEAVTAMQGHRPTGRSGGPIFQKMAYAALR